MPFPRPLGMSTKKDAAAGAPFQPTPVRASNPNNNDQRQGIIMAMVSCLLFCGIKFALCELGLPPYMALLRVIAAYVRTEGLYTSGKV